MSPGGKIPPAEPTHHHVTMGVNSCKSHGDCKGKNSCKGKGFLEMTQEDCDVAKAKMKDEMMKQ